MKIFSRKPKQLVDWQVIVKEGAALNPCHWSRCPGPLVLPSAEASLLLPREVSTAAAPLQKGRVTGGDTNVLEDLSKNAKERETATTDKHGGKDQADRAKRSHFKYAGLSQPGWHQHNLLPTSAFLTRYPGIMCMYSHTNSRFTKFAQIYHRILE